MSRNSEWRQTCYHGDGYQIYSRMCCIVGRAWASTGGVSNRWTGRSLYTLCRWHLSYHDSRATIWVWLHETTSAATQAARRALSFVLGALSLGSLCSIVSAAWRAPSCSILRCVMLLCWSFSQVTLRAWWYHTDNPRSFISRTWSFRLTTPRLRLRTWLRLPRNTRP